jgi:DNA repair exonuclease SbcCD ATPase subunit
MSRINSTQAGEELLAAEAVHAASTKSRDQALQVLRAAEGEAAAEHEADKYASHLSAIVEHGAILGLDQGRCPLCNAKRTGEEFKAALERARARLSGRSESLRTVAARVEEGKKAVSAADEAIAAAAARVVELRRKRAVVEEEVAAVRAICAENGFNVEADAPEALLPLLLTAKEQVAQVERALFVLEASTAIDRVKTLDAKVAELKQQSERAAALLSNLEKGVESARQIDASGKTVTNQLLEEQFNTVMPLLQELYRRLRPHPDWLDIEADFGGKVRASLNFVVGGAGNPQFLFSSGQRRAAGLAFLLAIHLSRTWCRLDSLVLDDPVQHIDDYRALNLAEVLAAIRRNGRQVIVAVEDVALADVLCRRLRSAAGDRGRRVDLRISESGATELSKVLDIAPLPSHALEEARAS